ncbi:MAG: glycosyltransferase family 39 protein [Kofleriaceae bacterium]|nr:glycosyltransferase family 39 protein [Myxococcales bacterium]MCB9564351.1 glycosyltransferase family 39 protein [Kofleriaceae bacterium]
MAPAEQLAPPTPPRLRRPAAVELVLVTILALAILLPGVWRYSLVDPWETHYGEVARRMLQDHDWVHTSWQNEGFRSKPVLTFWAMAASMKALGVADDGGYSGEMVSSARTMLAIRLPFILFGVLGLLAAWWMLARMAGRRVAYLSLLVLGTTPFYILVSRQGIPDITLVASMIGAVAMFAVAQEVGDEPLQPLAVLGRGRRRFTLDHRHVFALIVGGLLLLEAIYYVYYFTISPRLAGVRLHGLHPGWLIAGPMLVGLGLLVAFELPVGLGIAKLTKTRQVYMLWFYAFLGISVLGKGPPALGVVGIVCFFYVALLGRWRDLWNGRYELLRGVILLLLITVPWHVGMYFKEGRVFLREYFITHLWKRAAVGVDNEKGTFDYYMSQLGYGMHIWAALVPAAMAALTLRMRTDSPEGRARFVVALWAIATVAFFCVVQTKFHHYILPAVPALAMAVAFWLDDVLAGRARYLGLAAVIGAGILLVITNDMMGEEKQWIEMFVFRYDRPWPKAEPWAVDVTDGFLAIGLAGAAALLLLAIPRLSKLGVVAVGVAGLATAMWSLHVYMPEAATHWGMREAVRHYYEEREIHGVRLVYYGSRQVADDWALGDSVRDTWTIPTFVPDNVQEGQPVTIRVTVKSSDDRRTEQDLRLPATIIRVEDAALVARLDARALAQLAPIVKAGRTQRRSPRPPIKAVDGDRLIAWQLYWRGENFWSGDEIWGRLPEMQTALKETDNVKFLKYLNDRELCPEGRRYWVITEAGRANNLRTILPTARAKETFQIEDTTSNKFTLLSFIL